MEQSADYFQKQETDASIPNMGRQNQASEVSE
jgi:hypothetical protein